MARPRLAPLAERVAVTEPLRLELRRLRREQGLTQAEVAERMGVKRAYVSLLETGRAPISLPRLRTLASVYDVSPARLFGMLGVKEFDWVATLASELPLTGQYQLDSITGLDPDERGELLEYLSFLRWRREQSQAVGRGTRLSAEITSS